MAVLTWLGIYPSVTALLAALGRSLEPLPLPARTLVLTLLLVPLMTYLVMPALERVFAGWLYGKGREDGR